MPDSDAAAEQITALQEDIKLLAWLHTELAYLHAGLVEELRVIITQLTQAQTRDPAILARARRIAAHRAAQQEAAP